MKEFNDVLLEKIDFHHPAKIYFYCFFDLRGSENEGGLARPFRRYFVIFGF